MESPGPLDLSNPVNLVKVARAGEILDLLLGGMTITEACKTVGIDYSTHRYWVENGVYSTLVGQKLQEITQVSNQMIVARWSDMLTRLSDIALGTAKDTFPRDSLAAIKLIYELVILPAGKAAPGGTADEQAFLKKHEGFGWQPILQGGKIIKTTTLEYQPVETAELDFVEGEELADDQ